MMYIDRNILYPIVPKWTDEIYCVFFRLMKKFISTQLKKKKKRKVESY